MDISKLIKQNSHLKKQSEVLNTEAAISAAIDREIEQLVIPKPKNGKDGYTPQKGVDYFDGKDGYTPQKGVDYRDGINGKDGYSPVKNIDYFDGKDGKDGASIKGDRGEKGEKGKDGVTKVIKEKVTQTAEEIRDKLESLTDNDRLDAKAIKNLNKFIKQTVYAVSNGVRSFLGLSDAPDSYAGQAGKLVKVNSTETGLEFGEGNPGDITSVLAGDGMSGGGSSGDVTLTNADRGSSAVSSHVAESNPHTQYLQSFTESDPIWNSDKPSYSTTVANDTRYLKLDASNDPITGDLQVNANFGIGITPLEKFNLKSSSNASTLAANIIVNGGFTGNANGWTLGSGGGSPDWFYLLNTVRHLNGGGTAPLTPSTPLTIEAGAPYLVTFRVSGWVSGNVTPSLGDINGWPVTGNTVGAGSIDTQVIVASTTGNFALTPSSDFQGVVDNVVVRKITPTTPTIKIYDANEASSLELRASFAGNANTFLGVDSGLNAGTTASYNIGIGPYTLNRLTSGRDNIAIGYYALYYNTTGINNTALGSGALGLNTTGFYNFAAGSGALANNISGTYNWAGGDSALFSNTTGSANLAAGEFALYGNITGSYNTILGPEAFATGDGSYNVGIGFQAGIYETGSYKLYIDSTGSLTPLIYGEFDTKLFRINGHQEIIGNADVKQLIVKANATQTANLQEWQNSGGTILSLIDKLGGAVFNENGNASADFRVESDTEANMLFLDANGDTDGALYLGGSTNGAKVNKGGDTYWIGTGSGIPFGHMYTNTDVVVPVASANTWYEADINTPDFTAGELNLVTFTDHYLVVTKAGKYEIVHHADIKTTAAGDEIASTVMVNGTATETAHGHATMSTGNSAVPTMGVTILTLAANDQISLAVENHSGARNITITHAQISVKQIGA